MYNVLVISEMIPESVTVVLVPMTKDEFEKFKVANNYCVNGDEYDEDKTNIVNAVNNALCDYPDYLEDCETEMDKQYFGKWVKLKVEGEDLPNANKILRFQFCL